MTQTQIPQRGEVAPEYTWDTASVFASQADWEAEYARIERELPELARFRGHLADGPDTLAEYLDASERLANAADRVYFYGSMLHNTNTAD